jgi:pyruvate/2-oxoglutarate dehydrogenase complex dihydrolipoamide dehydrogenase (E3) component
MSVDNESTAYTAIVFGKSINVATIAKKLNFELDIRDRTYRFKTYNMCFVGEEAVNHMLKKEMAHSAEEAVAIGNILMNWGVIQHVVDPKMPFKNGYFFYKFNYSVDGKINMVTPKKVFLEFTDESKVNMAELEEIVTFLKSNLEVNDRTYQFRTYPKCFTGSEAVDLMLKEGYAFNEYDAERIGNVLITFGIFHHVLREHAFQNGFYFYRFAEDDPNASHGIVRKNSDGTFSSWADLAQLDFGKNGDLQSKALEKKEDSFLMSNPDLMKTLAEKELKPLDEFNLKLLNNVHPNGWTDPVPKPKYNLIVVGGGAAGLVTAAGAAGVGAVVALIEENLLGGDCLNFGCVPSKALIKAAKVAHTLKNSSEFGIEAGEVKVNFPEVMKKVRKVRADISSHDSALRFAEKMNVDVFLGRGEFTSETSIRVNGKNLIFTNAVIASGASPAVAPIPGLQSVPYFTNETIFNITTLPSSILVLGSGPAGCEFAQCFARFGSNVYLVNRSERLLSKEEKEAAEVVKNSMEKDGVKFFLGFNVERLSKVDEQSPQNPEFPLIEAVIKQENCDPVTLQIEAIVLCTGRRPNIGRMGLEKIGVDYNKAGIIVNDYLQTSMKNIYAVGDCCTAFKYTHVADFMARMVIRNALFFGSEKFSDLLIPWCTYTDPEIAHVGLYPRDLAEKGIAFDTFTKELADNDRAIIESDVCGFVRVYTRKGTDEILGASIVGDHAGDLISEISLAISSKTGLGRLATIMHPYPSRADAIRQTGDLYNRTRLTPFVKGVFRRLLTNQRTT